MGVFEATDPKRLQQMHKFLKTLHVRPVDFIFFFGGQAKGTNYRKTFYERYCFLLDLKKVYVLFVWMKSRLAKLTSDPREGIVLCGCMIFVSRYHKS